MNFLVPPLPNPGGIVEQLFRLLFNFFFARNPVWALNPLTWLGAHSIQ